MERTAASRVDDLQAVAQDIRAAVQTVIEGKPEAVELALVALFGSGHLLIEDVPGVGKTMLAKALARSIDGTAQRIQFTPDLLPSDITGSSVWDPQRGDFVFRPGPVFTGLFLADEINRTAPKTQSALLEAMAERQVTVEGVSRPLRLPFHVVATSNPVEYEGTYPLPEAQLDRFMVRLAVGYPDGAGEREVLSRRIARQQEAAPTNQVVTAETLRAMQTGVEALSMDADVLGYCVDIVAATRHHPALEVGASPRGSQNLALLARAVAVLDGRDVVLPEDVKRVAVPVLAHRLTLSPTAWASGNRPEDVVTDVLGTVAGPSTVRQG